MIYKTNPNSSTNFQVIYQYDHRRIQYYISALNRQVFQVLLTYFRFFDSEMC